MDIKHHKKLSDQKFLVNHQLKYQKWMNTRERLIIILLYHQVQSKKIKNEHDAKYLSIFLPRISNFNQPSLGKITSYKNPRIY